MEIIRKLLGLVNRTEEVNSLNGTITITPVYYLGHTYTAQPTPDELKRAGIILTTKNKKIIEKSLLPSMSINFGENYILLKNEEEDCCCSFDITRIVFSCVDAKNQKMLALFYHNDSPYIATSITVRGLECHMFLCKTRETARNAATKIGSLLEKKYNTQRPSNSAARQKHNIQTICENQLYYNSQPQESCPQQKLPSEQEQQKVLQPSERRINVKNNRIRYSKALDEDIEYDDIYKFFRKNVLNISHSNSFLSTQSDSLSTFLTTTGYDSGRASTAPSIDMKNEDLISVRIDVSIPDLNDGLRPRSEEIIKNRNSDISLNSFPRPLLNPDQDRKVTEQIGHISTIENNFAANSLSDFHSSECNLDTHELDRLLEMSETDI